MQDGKAIIAIVAAAGLAAAPAGALAGPPQLAAPSSPAAPLVAGSAAAVTAIAAPVAAPAAGEDYDEPVIVFGRAVDLAGTDIEPVSRSALAPAYPGASGRIPRGYPLASARLTSGFGSRVHPISGGLRFHTGLDMAAPYGAPVRATGAGRVSSAGWAGGYGQMVAINHGGSVETRYAHLSALAVHGGDSVVEGQVIGYVGSTGNSTGPHLHYETRVAGQARDPSAAWRR